MKKTAILLGSSGLVGGMVLQRLLEDENYECIKLFSRRESNVKHPKIVEFVGDLLELKKYEKDFKADEVFCCIGTTAKKTKDKAMYEKIDSGIPILSATLAKKNDIETFLVISAIGADVESPFFYNKTKGKMEEGVLNAGIKNTYILRPSLLYGARGEKRFLEDMGNVIFKFVSPLMVGFLRKYQPINASFVAKTMYFLAQDRPKRQIVTF